MALASVDIRGQRETIRALETLSSKLQRKAISKSSRISGKILMEAAKRYAPVDTGTLKKSIKVRALKRNRRGDVGVVVGTSQREFVGDLFYGAMVEYGTSKMEAKPYMRPAYEEKKDEIVSTYQREILNQVNSLRSAN